MATILWGKYAEQGLLTYLTGSKFTLLWSGKTGSKRYNVTDLLHPIISSLFSFFNEGGWFWTVSHLEQSRAKRTRTPHQLTWESMACPRLPLQRITLRRVELENMQICLTLKWTALRHDSSWHWRCLSRTLIITKLETVEKIPVMGETFLNRYYIVNYCMSPQLLSNNHSGLKQHKFIIS